MVSGFSGFGVLRFWDFGGGLFEPGVWVLGLGTQTRKRNTVSQCQARTRIYGNDTIDASAANES